MEISADLMGVLKWTGTLMVLMILMHTYVLMVMGHTSTLCARND